MLDIYAIYFPQFYETEYNSRWWGDGFTDWELIKKSTPQFSGHKQPRIPKMGFLDQSLLSTIKSQVALAKEYYIKGFNFYHYWFDSTPYLDKPIENFLKLDEKDSFEFFITWANESWTRQWVGKPNNYLLEQRYYESDLDIVNHYSYISSLFNDKRYKKINNKPIYCIYRPELIPNLSHVLDKFNELSILDGFDGIYFIAFRSYDLANANIIYEKFDALLNFNPRYCINFYSNRNLNFYSKYLRELPERFQAKLANIKKHFQKYKIYSYDDYIESLKLSDSYFDNKPIYDSVFPDWDNTPRYGNKATLFKDVTLDKFKRSLSLAYNKQNSFDDKFIIVNAWNEWSESAYLEPDNDIKFLTLEAIKQFVNSN